MRSERPLVAALAVTVAVAEAVAVPLAVIAPVAVALTIAERSPLEARAPDPADPGASPSGDPTDLLDPVAALGARLEAGGEEALARDPIFGYLPAVLEALDIPVSSQSLVFSRTSLQVDMIAPWAPRAIYFNDDVYVGYTVDGLVLEIASVDPDGGSVFYTVDQTRQDGARFRRDDLTCKACHETGLTGGVSGVLMRSVLTDRMGDVVTPIDDRPTDDRTPMAERFGGWYVTGAHSLAHAGNARAGALVSEIDDPTEYAEGFEGPADGEAPDLEDEFDPSFYLTEGSDIVALLVLAHQTRVHNLITSAAEAGEAALEELTVRRLRDAEADVDDLADATRSRLDYAVRGLVQGMLFYRAEPIGRVVGAGAFGEGFAARGPRDDRGRSFRDLSLDGRLFEYPLSFLVYSDAWDAMPALVRERAWASIDQVLTGEDDPDYPLLDADRRAAILEILLETKPEFAAFEAALSERD